MEEVETDSRGNMLALKKFFKRYPSVSAVKPHVSGFCFNTVLRV